MNALHFRSDSIQILRLLLKEKAANQREKVQKTLLSFILYLLVAMRFLSHFLSSSSSNPLKLLSSSDWNSFSPNSCTFFHPFQFLLKDFATLVISISFISFPSRFLISFSSISSFLPLSYPEILATCVLKCHSYQVILLGALE